MNLTDLQIVITQLATDKIVSEDYNLTQQFNHPVLLVALQVTLFSDLEDGTGGGEGNGDDSSPSCNLLQRKLILKRQLEFQVRGSFPNYVYKRRWVGVPKCPLFVNNYKVEHLNAGRQVVKKSQNLVNVIGDRPLNARVSKQTTNLPLESSIAGASMVRSVKVATKNLTFDASLYLENYLDQFFMKF